MSVAALFRAEGMVGTLYARLYNRDVEETDAVPVQPAPASPPLRASPRGEGVGNGREPEPVPSHDEMSLGDDQTVVD